MPPVGDLIMNSDLYNYPHVCTCGTSTDSSNGTTKETEKIYVMMPPPPSKFPLYPIPYPPYPDPHSCDCEDKNNVIKQSQTEKSICRLSKKAATLRTLIENISEKNKPVIIRSSATSYSLGEFKTVDSTDPDITNEDESIESIIEILKAKLTEIKEEIKTLSDELTD